MQKCYHSWPQFLAIQATCAMDQSIITIILQQMAISFKIMTIHWINLHPPYLQTAVSAQQSNNLCSTVTVFHFKASFAHQLSNFHSHHIYTHQKRFCFLSENFKICRKRPRNMWWQITLSIMTLLILNIQSRKNRITTRQNWQMQNHIRPI